MRAHGLASSLSTVAFALALAAGCGSGGNGDAAKALPIPLANYCAAVADDVCTRLVPCCTSAGFASTADACKSLETTACEARVQAASRAGMVYDAQAAGTCLASSGTFFDGCAPATTNHWAQQVGDEACTHVFVGKRQIGDTCTADTDCAPIAGARVGCARSTGPGTCVKIPRAKLGEACNLQPDAPFVACEVGTECVNDPKGASRCLGPVPEKGACGPATATCADGFSCDTLEQQCLPPAQIGEPCSRGCAKGLICFYDGSGGLAKCVEPPGLGERCQGQCSGNLRCLWQPDTGSNVCANALANGEKCNGTNDCASGYCDYSTYAGGGPHCATPPAGYHGYVSIPGVDVTACQRITPG